MNINRKRKEIDLNTLKELMVYNAEMRKSWERFIELLKYDYGIALIEKNPDLYRDSYELLKDLASERKNRYNRVF